MSEEIFVGGCLCGAVRYRASARPVRAVMCHCSMCRRRGAIVASVPMDGLKILEGADQLRVYQFNTRTAKHFFCSICGIYTHHQRRSNTDQYSFNVGCLEGLDPFEVAEVTVYDGVHHPRDFAGGGVAVAKRVRIPIA